MVSENIDVNVNVMQLYTRAPPLHTAWTPSEGEVIPTFEVSSDSVSRFWFLE